MAQVLFVCLHNAGRSQMSRALFERAAGDRHTADSAGTTPADRVHPEVVAVMREVRKTRDEIARRAATLISELDQSSSTSSVDQPKPRAPSPRPVSGS
jgi:protein-tyrosine-phosphatase